MPPDTTPEPMATPQPHVGTGWKWARGFMAAFIGLFMLACVLPNTGCILDGPTPAGMSRCGPYVFYPGRFLLFVSAVMVPTGCTLFGIARIKALEIVGWTLFGVLFLLALMGG